MPDMGKVHIRIIWNGEIVRGIEVRSTRTQAYRLLIGRLPENAVQLVPMLYSICGKAQQAAAIAATSAAQGNTLQQDKDIERGVACEAMQEHLWRLLLDWPERLELPKHQQQFVRWHGALKELSAGKGGAEKLSAELHQVLLGMTHAEWEQIDSYAKLSEWQGSGQGLLAPVFASLDHKESHLEFDGKPGACALLPNWNAAEVLQIYVGQLEHEFAVMPHYEGNPMETGALVLAQHAPLLQELLSKRPSRLLARLIARLADLLDSAEALALDTLASRVQSVSASNATGLSVVQTARGMLLHHVRIASERIEEYLIVAPTEWNFHPQGALVNGLTGLKENDEKRLLEIVKTFVLSLDPCVEHEIEISHA